MSKPKLFPYQLQDVRQIDRFNGRLILASEPGTGKTITSLWWARYYMDPGPVVVVCPASVKWHWQREALLHVNWRATVIEGSDPSKVPVPLKAPVYIVNYDIISPRQGKGRGGEKVVRRGWLKFLEELNPKLIIVDEGHKLGDPRTKQSKAVTRLCQGVPHVMVLSGTPLTLRPAQLYPSLKIIRPDLFHNWPSFANDFCGPKLTPWGMQYTGATNLNRLHKTLLCCMIRRRKADVLKELPPKTRVIVPVDIERKKEYEAAYHQFLNWLRARDAAKARRAARAENLVRRTIIKGLIGELKLKSVIGWVESFLEESEGKLLLFGIHKKVLDPIHERFRKLSVRVDGSVTGKNRQVAFDAFTRDNKIRLLIGNIRAAGTGWNGSAASDVAFCELADTPGEMLQAEDRPHRPGQTMPVTIHYLLAHGTMEERFCELLQKKQSILSQTLDGVENVDGGIDIWDMLEKELLRKGKS